MRWKRGAAALFAGGALLVGGLPITASAETVEGFDDVLEEGVALEGDIYFYSVTNDEDIVLSMSVAATGDLTDSIAIWLLNEQGERYTVALSYTVDAPVLLLFDAAGNEVPCPGLDGYATEFDDFNIFLPASCIKGVGKPLTVAGLFVYGPEGESIDLLPEEAVVVGYGDTSAPQPPPAVPIVDRPPPPPPPAPPAPAERDGYWMLQGNGGVVTFGDAPYYGAEGNDCWNSEFDCDYAEDLEPTPSGDGYWIVTAYGRVLSFGNAPVFSDTQGTGFAAAIKSTPSGQGAWVLDTNGCIWPLGDAAFYGSMCDKPMNGFIQDMAVTESGRGYWLLGSDGGIFSFGDAAFYGSTGNIRLNEPIVGMSSTPSGNGHWLVASDGGVFSFGDASFYGSTGSISLNAPVADILPSKGGGGYHLVAIDGGMFSFGDAKFRGSLGGNPPASGVWDADVLP